MIKRVFRFLAGLAFGCAVGLVLGLLWAPRSGEETKELIRSRLDEAMAEGRRAAEAKRAELLARLEEAKRPRRAYGR
ncbi:MAG TPA: YtxH domain-containing protein [Anaerolineae bacterium]|nr:YtxH domain-containing protein [Anaerolineae bacterium]